MSNEPRNPENGPGFEPDLENLQSEWDRMERAEPPGARCVSWSQGFQGVPSCVFVPHGP